MQDDFDRSAYGESVGRLREENEHLKASVSVLEDRVAGLIKAIRDAGYVPVETTNSDSIQAEFELW